MSSKIIRDRVTAYLNANWADTSIHGEDNVIDDPPANLDPWLSYSFFATPEERKSIGIPGGNCTEERGEVLITVYVPSGTGHTQALTYAEKVRTLMRGLQLGDLRFTTVDAPDTTFPSRVQASHGNWFGYQVVAYYVYNYTS